MTPIGSRKRQQKKLGKNVFQQYFAEAKSACSKLQLTRKPGDIWATAIPSWA
jgi:hypothetical protein